MGCDASDKCELFCAKTFLNKIKPSMLVGDAGQFGVFSQVIATLPDTLIHYLLTVCPFNSLSNVINTAL